VSVVLVLDGRSRAALQIVRSLGKKGIKVVIGNDSWACSSFFSKYVDRRLVYPEPNSDSFKDCIFDFLEKNRIDMIIPVRDDTTIFCAKYQQDLSKFTHLLISDHNTIMVGRDKSRTVEEAKKHGVPCPKTIVITRMDELCRGNTIGFPFVLKPTVSSGSRGLRVIRNNRDLDNLRPDEVNRYGSYLVQEYIPSDRTVGVNVLFDAQNNMKAIFTYMRLREYPRNGGPSVLRESTDDRQIKELALRFFKGIRWKGVAMIEFKIDKRDGVPKLMEVNPRFWGSLALPIFAGVDFPFLLYQLALGKDIDVITNYRLGVRARWLLMGDLLWLMKSKNLAKDISDFSRFFDRNQTYDIISISDPVPAVGAILEGFLFVLNHKKRKHAFSRG